MLAWNKPRLIALVVSILSWSVLDCDVPTSQALSAASTVQKWSAQPLKVQGARFNRSDNAMPDDSLLSLAAWLALSSHYK